MSGFELPANIKQIGSIGQGLRIYVEDYVCSYLQQYAAAGGYDERLALLIGRCIVIDGQQVLFIGGAVQGRFIKIENGVAIFTQKSMDYANDMIKKYFQGMAIVGWAQSQPSYGVFLNTAYAEYHVNNFKDEYNVLFVIDPIEKVNCFYKYNSGAVFDKSMQSGGMQLTESPGYFIYYEKNRGMHDYMIENKSDQEVSLKIPAESTNEESTEREDEPEEPQDEADDKESRDDGDFLPEALIRNRQSVRNLKRTSGEHRRILNLLVTLSAVLFIICFIMAAGLVRNQDRISSMENQIVQLSTSYRNLLLDLRDNTASVFAANPDESANIETEPSVEETVGSDPTDQPTESPAGLIEVDGNSDSLEPMQIETPSPTAEAVKTNETEELSDMSADETQVEEATPTPTEIPVVEKPQENRPPDTYTVQKGDSLSHISIKFYGTRSMVEKIMDINGMVDDKIYYGKVLKLP